MDRLQACLSLRSPSHHPPCPPGLRIRLMKKKTFQSLPKDGVLWQGRAGELCPAQLGAALFPGRAPRCTTPRGVSPAWVQACPEVAQLLGAAGRAQGLQNPAELCPACSQRAVNAQWVSRRHMSMFLWGPCETALHLRLHRHLGHHLLWLCSSLGWGRRSCHGCVPIPCQSSTACCSLGHGAEERLCWAGTGALQRCWMHMELSHSQTGHRQGTSFVSM